MRQIIALFLLFFATVANATTFSDLKFGKYQFSDTQWNVSACLYTSTCQIYSLSGIGTSWNTGSPYTLSTTQYIQFSPSNDPNYPWTMKVYNSNGTVAAILGNGKLSVQGLGTDSSGRHFFFFINSNYNGTVFSTDYGFPNSNGFSFTGTSNPTVAQTNSFASSGSTSPLSPGQTYAATPTYPTVTITSSQQTKINQTQTLSATNSVYLESYGDYNNVYIEQKSAYNTVRGINGAQYMLLNGSNNNITINQGTTGTIVGKNLAEVSVIGPNNILNLMQQYNNKYAEVSINGLGNNLTLQQKDNGGKSLFMDIGSNGNTVSVLQQGSGNHFATVTSPYGGANVSITQDGSAQKLFSLTLNSSNVGVTIIQNNPTATDSAAMSITCSASPCTGYTYTKN